MASVAARRHPFVSILALLLPFFLATLSHAAVTISLTGSKPVVYVGRTYRLTVTLTQQGYSDPKWGNTIKNKMKASNYTDHAMSVSWLQNVDGVIVYKRSRAKPHLPKAIRKPVVGTGTLNWAAVPLGQYEEKDYVAKFFLRFKAENVGSVVFNADVTPVGGVTVMAEPLMLDVDYKEGLVGKK